MQDYNKQNLILLGIFVAVGLTIFFSAILVFESPVLWAAPLPVAAITYAIVVFIKKYLPLTKNQKSDK